MYKRLLRAVMAKEGVDIDDTRHKFTIEQEKKETEQMIKRVQR